MFNTPDWQRYSGNFVTSVGACLRKGQQGLASKKKVRVAALVRTLRARAT